MLWLVWVDGAQGTLNMSAAIVALLELPRRRRTYLYTTISINNMLAATGTSLRLLVEMVSCGRACTVPTPFVVQ